MDVDNDHDEDEEEDEDEDDAILAALLGHRRTLGRWGRAGAAGARFRRAPAESWEELGAGSWEELGAGSQATSWEPGHDTDGHTHTINKEVRALVTKGA